MRSGISVLTIIDFGVGVKNDRKIAEWVIGLSRNQRSYNPEMGGRNAPKYACKAGAYGDALNKCLVSSADAAQIGQIINWVFVAQSKHPLNKEFYSPQKLTDELAAVRFGNTLADLYGASCRSEADMAVKVEGRQVIQTSVDSLIQHALLSVYVNDQVKSYVDMTDRYFAEELAKKKAK